MIRVLARPLVAALVLVVVPLAGPALAERSKPASAGSVDKKAAGKRGAEPEKAEVDPKKGKSVQIANSGDWRGFLAQSGKDKTCYALASPKDREPTTLKRDAAYMFISNRPGENVRNEISIMLGFPVKDGGDAHAEIGGTNFDLVAKGTNAWIKNPADEGRFIDVLKKGGKLVVKAPFAKGKMTSDSYTLAGLKQVLDKVQKECP